jgi:hypothetical protein
MANNSPTQQPNKGANQQ